MEENKKIKVVNIIIKANRLLDERENVLLFKNTGRGKGLSPIMFPKKCMYNFEKIEMYFPHWKGRVKEKAFKFDIPRWLYLKMKSYDLPRLGGNVIIKDTHQ